jgi:hypothetical protein
VPSFSVIQDISLELRRQIFAALQATPDTDFGLAGSIDVITLQPPSETLDAGIIASLYLYHVEVDKHLRNQRPLPDRIRDDEFRRPPIPLQLRYLFTPVDDDETVNQLLLGRVVQHFYDAPHVVTLSGEPIGDAFGGASPTVRIKPDLLSLEQLSQIWNAFSTPYRIALAFLVEVVAIDSALPNERRHRVEEMVLGVGEGRE